jgi:hypothetical protein
MALPEKAPESLSQDLAYLADQALSEKEDGGEVG